MEQYSYELETITPLYGHGFSKDIPEFRLSEIKALMRFAFRAVRQPNKPRILYNEEGKLFGQAGGEAEATASSIRLRLKNANCNVHMFEAKLLFRNKEKNKTVTYIDTKNIFYVQMTRFAFKPSQVLFDEYKKWFELSLALFGIGGRARRGRGCFSFKSEYLNFDNRQELIKSLCQLLNEAENKSNAFIMKEDKIIRQQQKTMHVLYPWIQTVQVGKKYSNWRQLLHAIDVSSHDHDSDYTGYVGNQQNPGRYASPIYVSAVQLKDGSLLPIITRLNYDKGRIKGKDKSIDFIEQILTGKEV